MRKEYTPLGRVSVPRLWTGGGSVEVFLVVSAALTILRNYNEFYAEIEKAVENTRNLFARIVDLWLSDTGTPPSFGPPTVIASWAPGWALQALSGLPATLETASEASRGARRLPWPALALLYATPVFAVGLAIGTYAAFKHL